MILSEIDPNANVDISSDLGLSNNNWNYNWIGDVRQHYSELNLTEVDTLVQQICSKEVIVAEKLNTVNIDYQTLNKDQMKIFK